MSGSRQAAGAQVTEAPAGSRRPECPDDMPGRLSPVTSDTDGRFSLHGVGPGFRAILTVHDPRFSTEVIEI
jgi:hypothetical protein